MRTSALAVLPLFALSLIAAGCGHHERHARGPAPTGPAQADAQLDQLADAQAKAASARRSGAPLNGEILHGQTFDPGDSREFRVQLDGEHCYWFGGATNEMGEKLYVTVLDPHGSKVASEKGKTEALIEYCPTTDGIYKVEGKLAHHGLFSVAVYAGTRLTPAASPVGVAELTPEQLIAKEAASVAPGAKQVGTFYEGNADEMSWSTSLTKGHCYWFIGAGTPGKTKKLWLYVWDPANKRVTDNRGDSHVVNAGVCANDSGMFKFQGKVHSGSGPYKFAVFEKAE